MLESHYFSTAQVAQALGVSVTTIKRWVDEGVLPAHRTVGGHRKILLCDLLRLVREGNFPRLDLARLPLPAPAGELPDPERAARELFAALKSGDGDTVRSLLHGAYHAGVPLEVLADTVITPAMAQVGHEWEDGRIEVFHEHRATQLCEAALRELKPLLEAQAGRQRPRAVGGAVEHEFHGLGSLLAQLVLIDAGWEAIDLGVYTPLAALRKALHELRPRLLWLSIGTIADPVAFLAEYRELYREAEQADVTVAVGGRGLTESVRALMPYTTFGDGMCQLAAFARSLHPLPRIPKRGRPPR